MRFLFLLESPIIHSHCQLKICMQIFKLVSNCIGQLIRSNAEFSNFCGALVIMIVAFLNCWFPSGCRTGFSTVDIIYLFLAPPVIKVIERDCCRNSYADGVMN